jgi:hypothetical protein
MTADELLQELRRLAETDLAGLDALAGKILAHCREAPAAIVGEWARDDGGRSTNAAVVARKLHELALGEMLGRVEAASADLRVRLITTLLDGAMDLRSLVLDQVEPLLDDRTALEPPWPGRARDVAYVLIRRMDGQPRDGEADRRYLDAPESERDDEIGAWERAQAEARAAEMEF